MIKTLRLSNREISYELTRKRVKNINLRIRADGSIAVSAAKSVPLSAIENFLRSKEAWILAALSRKTPTVTLPQGQAYLCGELVDVPVNISVPSWQKQMADKMLREQYENLWTLFQNDGFPKPALRFRKMKSRWGSCIPSKGVITLNTALVGAPIACQQAVIAHELCHMRCPNHQRDFYHYLYNRCPNYDSIHSQLRDLAPILLDSSNI